MHIRRLLLVAVSAATLGGGIVTSAATAAPTSVAAGHAVTEHTHLTAKFLAEAQAALVKDLRKPDTALFPGGQPRPGVIRETTAATSYNWAGYADVSTTAGTYTKASASWTVPAVTCTSEDRVTSEWVGLDGFGTATVEQDGTSSQCFQGVALYYSWYEMYPAGTVEVGTTVAAGDSISASVNRSGTSYTLALTDSTNPSNSFTETQSCAASTCLDESAEIITERPAYATTGIVPEAQFGTDKFTNVSVAPLNVSEIYDITCIDSTATYDIVSTSGVIGGNSFTNTWQDSY
jgi:hypothetical protein